jgi:hypothetical protein
VTYASLDRLEPEYLLADVFLRANIYRVPMHSSRDLKDAHPIVPVVATVLPAWAPCGST